MDVSSPLEACDPALTSTFPIDRPSQPSPIKRIQHRWWHCRNAKTGPFSLAQVGLLEESGRNV